MIPLRRIVEDDIEFVEELQNIIKKYESKYSPDVMMQLSLHSIIGTIVCASSAYNDLEKAKRGLVEILKKVIPQVFDCLEEMKKEDENDSSV